MPVAQPRSSTSQAAVRRRLAGALLLNALLLAALARGQMPVRLGLVYLGVGLASFTVYGLDKLAAINGTWRTLEETLHGLDFLGGIVGGLLAQAAFRHKISKPVFGRTTALIAAFHFAGLAVLALGLVTWPAPL